MDLARITWFTLATALAATAVMIPPGLLLAWLLARHRFRGRVLLDTLVSLPLVIRAVATARADSGEVYRSNTARYTLTLRHTCGNGRIDDGEQCDPNAPDACSGFCNLGSCTLPVGRACTTDADCLTGTCIAPDDPSECICTY